MSNAKTSKLCSLNTKSVYGLRRIYITHQTHVYRIVVAPTNIMPCKVSVLFVFCFFFFFSCRGLRVSISTSRPKIINIILNVSARVSRIYYLDLDTAISVNVGTYENTHTQNKRKTNKVDGYMFFTPRTLFFFHFIEADLVHLPFRLCITFSRMDFFFRSLSLRVSICFRFFTNE